MFVTGLEFLPLGNNRGPAISSDTEAAVLSISVDNKVCIHSLQHRRMFKFRIIIRTMLKQYFFIFNYRHNSGLVGYYTYCGDFIFYFCVLFLHWTIGKYD